LEEVYVRAAQKVLLKVDNNISLIDRNPLGILYQQPENTKGGSITILLTSCLTVLDLSVLQLKIKIVGSHTADSKPVKQEVNGTVILPPLVFPAAAQALSNQLIKYYYCCIN
jgi:hypothetical protein